ncbi:hypothetical protein A1OE_301 [Candidatus Endolissoclinum faulkneri L2]|uniref:Uncharacterized protein n=1 Tax=Candidatus Endolissoclinum faulkneri L2 TaxID=1193729 RepID=K7YFY4_9PROT|nr:hypothetical protein A1OE_301 [Candidatus Endolissoclinum faulkneri L2]
MCARLVFKIFIIMFFILKFLSLAIIIGITSVIFCAIWCVCYTFKNRILMKNMNSRTVSRDNQNDTVELIYDKRTGEYVISNPHDEQK